MGSVFKVGSTKFQPLEGLARAQKARHSVPRSGLNTMEVRQLERLTEFLTGTNTTLPNGAGCLESTRVLVVRAT